MKLFLLAFIVSTVSFASVTINCNSSQTGYDYVMDPDNSSVTIYKANGKRLALASLKFVDGMGEDIIFKIMDGDYEVGIINGEEGVITGKFDLSIFESDINDEELVCEFIR